MTCDDSARMVIPHLNGPSPITTRSVSPAQVNPVITITNKVQNRQTVVVDICSSNFYEACNLEPSLILFGGWCSQLRSDSVVTAVYVYYNQEFLPRKQIIQFLKNVASRTHVNYSPSQHLHCMLGICSRGIKYWTWCHQFLTARAAPEVISLATKRLSFSIWVHILRRKWSVCEEMKHFSNDIVICYHLTAECRASIRRSAAVLSPLSTVLGATITTFAASHVPEKSGYRFCRYLDTGDGGSYPD